MFYIEHIILFFPYDIIKCQPDEKYLYKTATEFIGELYINFYEVSRCFENNSIRVTEKLKTDVLFVNNFGNSKKIC
jgi:hypothetical protein